MFNGRYFNGRYFAPRFWAKLGADAPDDICGNVIGADLSYANVTGGIADHQVTGGTIAYVSVTGDDQECP